MSSSASGYMGDEEAGWLWESVDGEEEDTEAASTVSLKTDPDVERPSSGWRLLKLRDWTPPSSPGYAAEDAAGELGDLPGGQDNTARIEEWLADVEEYGAEFGVPYPGELDAIIDAYIEAYFDGLHYLHQEPTAPPQEGLDLLAAVAAEEEEPLPPNPYWLCLQPCLGCEYHAAPTAPEPWVVRVLVTGMDALVHSTPPCSPPTSRPGSPPPPPSKRRRFNGEEEEEEE
jgi:hypothetical protein